MNKQRLLELAGVQIDEGQTFERSWAMLRYILKEVRTAIKHYEEDPDPSGEDLVSDLKLLLKEIDESKVKV